MSTVLVVYLNIHIASQPLKLWVHILIGQHMHRTDRPPHDGVNRNDEHIVKSLSG
jgi:hypothetical protein